MLKLVDSGRWRDMFLETIFRLLIAVQFDVSFACIY